MSSRAFQLKYYGPPPATPSGRPSSRSSSTAIQEKFWKPAYIQTARALTVYDTIPTSMGGKDYKSWTSEWLPRLIDPCSTQIQTIQSDRRMNPSVRNPIGFAIDPHSSQFDRNPDIEPVVLHFTRDSERPGGQTRSRPNVRTKPIRKVYTRSVFRRVDRPERADIFDDQRPLSTKKRLAERVIRVSSASCLPRAYRLPDRGEEREKQADVIPEVRRENYSLTDKRKYVILSQSLSAVALSSTPETTLETTCRHVLSRGYDSRTEEQLKQFGVAHDPHNIASSAVSKKGSLCHGHAWKFGDPEQGQAEVITPLLVRNSVVKPRSFDKIKVKDILAPNEYATKSETELEKVNDNNDKIGSRPNTKPEAKE